MNALSGVFSWIVVCTFMKEPLLACTDLKGVLGDSRQAVVHGSPSPGVEHDLPDLVCLTQLGRPVRFHDTHES